MKKFNVFVVLSQASTYTQQVVASNARSAEKMVRDSATWPQALVSVKASLARSSY